jgi:hypothetical protein
MFRLKSGEELLRGPRTACPDILFPLPDALRLVRESGQVEQPLISLYVLDDGLRLAVDGKHDRALGFSQLPHHLDRVIAEGCERLNIFTELDAGAIAKNCANTSTAFCFSEKGYVNRGDWGDGVPAVPPGGGQTLVAEQLVDRAQTGAPVPHVVTEGEVRGWDAPAAPVRDTASCREN